jgi:hypothetical protein
MVRRPDIQREDAVVGLSVYPVSQGAIWYPVYINIKEGEVALYLRLLCGPPSKKCLFSFDSLIAVRTLISTFHQILIRR